MLGLASFLRSLYFEQLNLILTIFAFLRIHTLFDFFFFLELTYYWNLVQKAASGCNAGNE